MDIFIIFISGSGDAYSPQSAVIVGAADYIAFFYQLHEAEGFRGFRLVGIYLFYIFNSNIGVVIILPSDCSDALVAETFPRRFLLAVTMCRADEEAMAFGFQIVKIHVGRNEKFRLITL